MPDDRPFYPHLNSFSPGVDEMFTPSGGEMELCGRRPNPRKHHSGRDLWYHKGTHYHGDQADFLGESPQSKFVPNEQGELNPCFDPEPIWFMSSWKMRALRIGPVVPLKKFGARFAARAVPAYPYPEAAYVRPSFGVVGLPIIPPVVPRRIGAALGVVAVDVVPIAEGLFFGLALGIVGVNRPIQVRGMGIAAAVVGIAVVAPAEVSSIGLELATLGDNITYDPTPIPAGVAFGRGETALPIAELPTRFTMGLTETAIPPTIEARSIRGLLALDGTHGAPYGPVEPHSVAFSGGVSETPIPPEVKTEGAAFGLTEGTFDDVPPIPGSDCAGAPTIALGTSYGGTLAGFNQHWWKFPVTSGTTYHVRLSVTSGNINMLQVNTGTSCSGLTLQFSLLTDGTCNTFTASSDGTCYIEVFGDMMGSGDYSFVADLGACP